MFKKDKRRKKVEDLYKIKSELKETAEKYLSETRKELDDIEKELEREIKNILENKNHQINEEIEEKIKKTKEEIKKNVEEMKKEKEELKERVELMLKKLIDIRFYPPEYIFELNMIRGLTIEIEDNIEKNPMVRIDFEERTSKLENEIEKYLRLHDEVLEFVEKETDDMEVIKLKEELSRDLQMGRLDDIEKKLKTKKSQ